MCPLSVRLPARLAAPVSEPRPGLAGTGQRITVGDREVTRRVDAARFRQLKKTMIERQCQDLIEFIEPTHSLDLLVGQDEAKKRLADDATLIARGDLDTAPMGYLVCGPVGTGKSRLHRRARLLKTRTKNAIAFAMATLRGRDDKAQ